MGDDIDGIKIQYRVPLSGSIPASMSWSLQEDDSAAHFGLHLSAELLSIQPPSRQSSLTHSVVAQDVKQWMMSSPYLQAQIGPPFPFGKHCGTILNLISCASCTRYVMCT